MSTPPSPHASAKRQRLYFLDLLRIVAYASVLVGHKYQPAMAAIVQDEHRSGALRWLLRGLMPFFEGGAFGVMVFFLVSGFIITDVVKQESTAVFLIKRACRIYPAYVAACLIEGALAPEAAPALSWPMRAAQWLLVGDWVGAPYTLGAVEWTLRVELLFYAYMAAWARLGILRHALIAMAVYLATALALFFMAPWPHHAGWSNGYANLYFPVLLVGSCICLGQGAPRLTQLTALLVVVAMVLLSMAHTAQIQTRWRDHHFVELALLVFMLALVFRSRIVFAAWGTLLSDLSYSVYLMHNWLWGHLAAVAQSITQSAVLVNGLVVCQLLLVCWLMLVCVERPGIRLGKWLAQKLQREPAKRLASKG